MIGSGFGGLAAAVRLGRKGYRVTVLEKLDAPGGRAYVLSPGRLHLRRRPDHRHRALSCSRSCGRCAARRCRRRRQR
ncbi:MAG: NAD(P)-binding protein [Rhodopseudomonas palustris]|nr:NAD(P)-binding protein [Rhodopseudomonas palustris]